MKEQANSKKTKTTKAKKEELNLDFLRLDGLISKIKSDDAFAHSQAAIFIIHRLATLHRSRSVQHAEMAQMLLHKVVEEGLIASSSLPCHNEETVLFF